MIEDIIDKCRGGENRVAQRELYEYTYRKLLVCTLRYAKEREEGQWIFNLAMFKIYDSLDGYAKGTNYLAWARNILVRTSIDYLRKNAKNRSMMVPVEIQDDITLSREVNLALDSLETEQIITVIQALPERERLIFSMYEIDGYSHVEIEKHSGIKKNTSKWLLACAKKSLRKSIKGLYRIKKYSNE